MKLNVRTSNRYSDKKIVWQTEKLQSLKDKVVTPPIYVRIKPINACCHSCSWCAYNSGNTNLDFEAIGMHKDIDHKSRLSGEKLMEVLADLKDMGVKCVTYSGGGEPLMHPNILEILRTTKAYNIGLSIITNGQLLMGERAIELAEADWVRVSMDYCDAKMFHASRGMPEPKYQVVIDNIANFAKTKNPDCDLSINYIITKENYTRVYDAAVLLKSLGVDNVRFSPVWTVDYCEYHKNIKDEVLEQLSRAKELQTETYKVYHSYNIREGMDKRSYHKCFIQQIIPVVGADYNVYNCHNKAYTVDGIIGNIKEQSFKQMWFSEATKTHFEEFDSMKACDNCQCANDSKNIFMHELLDCEGDNYV